MVILARVVILELATIPIQARVEILEQAGTRAQLLEPARQLLMVQPR
jgi:hypothetical protein